MIVESIKDSLLPSITNNYNNTLLDCESNINELDSLMNDFLSLDFTELEFKSKELLIEAQLDIMIALNNGLSAFYRQAYNSLRSSLELTIFAIYFKNREYEYYLWEKSGVKGEDARWGNTFEELSKKTILDYYEIDLDYKDYTNTLNNTNKLYSQLSNYTHGKPSHLQIRTLIKAEYNKNEFLKFLAKWKETIESILYISNVFLEGELYE